MFLLRKADQCQRLKALARRDRDRDHGADRPGPAWGPVMGLQMRTRGNSHAGCRRQRWVAIFNLSTLHRVGLQIVRGSDDIWMDMYCSKWEAVICPRKDLTIKRSLGGLHRGMVCTVCPATGIYLNLEPLSHQPAPGCPPPRLVFNLRSSSPNTRGSTRTSHRTANNSTWRRRYIVSVSDGRLPTDKN